jgi:ribonucleotide monophosphatase NagD (HAD superfamily)
MGTTGALLPSSAMTPLARGEMVMVGDSFQCDVKGGKAAGMLTVWVDPSFKVG